MRIAIRHSPPPIRLRGRSAFAFQSLLCGLLLQMTATVASAGKPVYDFILANAVCRFRFAVAHSVRGVRLHSILDAVVVAFDDCRDWQTETACTNSSSRMQFSVVDSQTLIRPRSQGALIFHSSPLPWSADMTPAVETGGMVFSSKLCKCGFANAVCRF
jgi:hypothetical protein